eukprot:Amastigsp_a512790_103.p3 type:complete len:125 gc:universal Amastigsp_a512790_103:1437-1063(-)
MCRSPAVVRTSGKLGPRHLSALALGSRDRDCSLLDTVSARDFPDAPRGSPGHHTGQEMAVNSRPGHRASEAPGPLGPEPGRTLRSKVVVGDVRVRVNGEMLVAVLSEREPQNGGHTRELRELLA